MVLYSFLSQWHSSPPALWPRSASSILQNDMDKVWSAGATEEKNLKIAPKQLLLSRELAASTLLACSEPLQQIEKSPYPQGLSGFQGIGSLVWHPSTDTLQLWSTQVWLRATGDVRKLWGWDTEQGTGMSVQTSPQWESHPSEVFLALSLAGAGFPVCHHCQPHTCWILQAGVSG